MGNTKERSKGQNVNKVWTPIMNELASFLLFFSHVHCQCKEDSPTQISLIGTKGSRLHEYRELRWGLCCDPSQQGYMTAPFHDPLDRLHQSKDFDLHTRATRIHFRKIMEWKLSPQVYVTDQTRDHLDRPFASKDFNIHVKARTTHFAQNMV